MGSGVTAGKTAALVLAVFLIISFSHALPGEGTEQDPYRVDSCRDLQEVGNPDIFHEKTSEFGDPTGEGWMEDTPDYHYELQSDIDCSETSNWNSGGDTNREFKPGFNPIGGNTDPGLVTLTDQRGHISFEREVFNGVFDGNNHTISNLTINRYYSKSGEPTPPNRSIGLFGRIGEEGVVKNFTLYETWVTGHRNIGTVAGVNNGKIKDVYSFGIVKSQTYVNDWAFNTDVFEPSELGGIAGVNNGKIRDVFSHTVISSPNATKVGGIAGTNNGNISRASSHTTGINASKYVSGLVGFNMGTIRNSYVAGNISGDNYVGGIMGGPSTEIYADEYSIYIDNSSDLITSYQGVEIDESHGKLRLENLYSAVNVNPERNESNSEGGLIEIHNGAVYGGETRKLENETVTNVYYLNRTAEEKGVPKPVTNAELSGKSAKTQLEGFNFNQTWRTIDHSEENYNKSAYPVLRSMNTEIQYVVTKSEEPAEAEESISPGPIQMILEKIASIAEELTGKETGGEQEESNQEEKQRSETNKYSGQADYPDPETLENESEISEEIVVSGE